METEPSEVALRAQLIQRRTDNHEKGWKTRQQTPRAKETLRFTMKLIDKISPEELIARDFSIPINQGFGQVIHLANELDVNLEHVGDVRRLLENGYYDTRTTLLHADPRLIGEHVPLEAAILSATHERTARSIANLALSNEEGMRNRINRSNRLKTSVDEASGVTVLDEGVDTFLSSKVYNTGCPYASRSSRIEPFSREVSPVFIKFVKYAGEVAARCLSRP